MLKFSRCAKFKRYKIKVMGLKLSTLWSCLHSSTDASEKRGEAASLHHYEPATHDKVNAHLDTPCLIKGKISITLVASSLFKCGGLPHSTCYLGKGVYRVSKTQWMARICRYTYMLTTVKRLWYLHLSIKALKLEEWPLRGDIYIERQYYNRKHESTLYTTCLIVCLILHITLFAN